LKLKELLLYKNREKKEEKKKLHLRPRAEKKVKKEEKMNLKAFNLINIQN
jgi:hypothetical protein